jgi:sigma-B regulation protein RsbU (phosphoserine phosphatase)
MGEIMSDFRECIPQLGEIVRPIEQISPDVKVKEVVEIFRNDHSLPAIPVVSAGKFIGFISRKGLFFKRLSHKYALDLYGNKPISILLEGNAAAMEPELDINSTLARLLTIDPDLDIDCFPAVKDDRFVGMVSVSDLMMEVSKTQSFLLEKLTGLSARIRDEVARASKIQQDLLPVSSFEFQGISIDAGITTSSEIGGDFYDYFTVGDDRLGLIIADVSGHGVQAGMVTTAAKASLHTLISMDIFTPSELLNGMNKAIIATACRSLLMTCLVALIDLKQNRLFYANAGHNFPYLYRGESRKLDQLDKLSGFPLGFEPDSTFREFCTPFNRGDTLLLYTDGIIECRNRREEEFGYERFEHLLREGAILPPKELRTGLLENAVNFIDSSEFEDDITIMVASYRQV